MNRLEGKVCVITGAANGIGLAIAERFLAEGATVVIADLNMEQAEIEAKRLGEHANAWQVDVTSSDSVKHMIDETVSRFGKIDVLVNNAGLGVAANVIDTSEEDFDRVIAVNLKGVFLGMKYAVPHMRRQGSGSIINMSSIGGLAGLYDRAAYCAAKGGVATLTKAAAIDHAMEGIRINAIAPGTVNTPWVQRITSTLPDPEAARQKMRDRQAHGRLVEPSEVAAMAAYLASDESASTIGAIMLVDGGFMAR
jgi:NAD(P)-dependent dehydrogenase (short-subunit alcohol dehydrogenase family)